MTSHLERLYAHNAWADARAITAMRSAEAEGHDVARARGLLAHVVAVEAVWLARAKGRTPEVQVWPTFTLDECEALARRTHDELEGMARSLDDAGAACVVHYRNSAGAEFDSTLEDILLHAALHGAYHRGQIALLVRDAGGEPSPTDYIAFVRGAAAATRQDAGRARPERSG